MTASADRLAQFYLSRKSLILAQIYCFASKDVSQPEMHFASNATVVVAVICCWWSCCCCCSSRQRFTWNDDETSGKSFDVAVKFSFEISDTGCNTSGKVKTFTSYFVTTKHKSFIFSILTHSKTVPTTRHLFSSSNVVSPWVICLRTHYREDRWITG